MGKGSLVRTNAVVHLRTSLPAGTVVPLGWVAIGDPLNTAVLEDLRFTTGMEARGAVGDAARIRAQSLVDDGARLDLTARI